ncbi:response regulator [Actinoplanes regularis]|uniref:Two component transcriptional regulator, LuxR family n=1 Tax=Actinoplanes regularis TaxID=52697 RepID=A0A239I870_9ACTN|nr:response regulator transcription factor [Actinoplanes regularis]GIE91307.1 DNA-binding response regulator [Actinoplanes regularis]SNS89488.1 two component transcriptional regulator, LuxR family [Actinoplanes regularis]
MIRVLLADDQTLVRAGFRSILGGEPDIEVVAEAGDGAEAVRLSARDRPDVVLMDVRMPVLDGIEATTRIVADPSLAAVKVVILTTFDHDEYVYGALRAGASGFLVKDTEPVELIRGVRVVARGDGLLAPSVTRRLIAEFASRSSAPVPPVAPNDLTPREGEIADLVATGRSNEEIATTLMISSATVKTHITRILAKLSLRDRAQLVVWAYESGRTRPGWLD